MAIAESKAWAVIATTLAMPVSFAWVEQNSAVLFGLFVGTIAYFGSLLQKGEPVNLRQGIGFVMQLGVIGLFCAATMQWLELGQSLWGASLTALFAMSANEVIEWARKGAWKRVLRAAFPSIFEEPKTEDQP